MLVQSIQKIHDETLKIVYFVNKEPCEING